MSQWEETFFYEVVKRPSAFWAVFSQKKRKRTGALWCFHWLGQLLFSFFIYHITFYYYLPQRSAYSSISGFLHFLMSFLF